MAWDRCRHARFRRNTEAPENRARELVTCDSVYFTTDADDARRLRGEYRRRRSAGLGGRWLGAGRYREFGSPQPALAMPVVRSRAAAATRAWRRHVVEHRAAISLLSMDAGSRSSAWRRRTATVIGKKARKSDTRGNGEAAAVFRSPLWRRRPRTRLRVGGPLRDDARRATPTSGRIETILTHVGGEATHRGSGPG